MRERQKWREQGRQETETDRQEESTEKKRRERVSVWGMFVRRKEY